MFLPFFKNGVRVCPTCCLFIAHVTLLFPSNWSSSTNSFILSANPIKLSILQYSSFFMETSNIPLFQLYTNSLTMLNGSNESRFIPMMQLRNVSSSAIQNLKVFYKFCCMSFASWIYDLRGKGPPMPDFPQFSLINIFQNIKRFSIGSCNEILNR